MNARFELLDGDTEVLPGLEVIATPGHTVGHQCVVVRGGQDDPAGPAGPAGFDLLIGDAAYTPRQYTEPDFRPVRPATSRRGASRYSESGPCNPTACISATTPI
jgi:glyoxylase-like metal-dependent hydrolase (beta-lactamase superfamily II)